jgi:hypothetical protein
VEPEPLAATGATLDPLAVGSAGLLGVEESQGAQILTLAYHFAGDGVAARATRRNPLLFVGLRQECPTVAVFVTQFEAREVVGTPVGMYML